MHAEGAIRLEEEKIVMLGAGWSRRPSDSLANWNHVDRSFHKVASLAKASAGSPKPPWS